MDTVMPSSESAGYAATGGCNVLVVAVGVTVLIVGGASLLVVMIVALGRSVTEVRVVVALLDVGLVA